MAIDDNKIYGLTGAQIKDLPAKTKAYADGVVGTETTARQTADTGLQAQIDAITASSDVVDVVDTKADLDAYDTTTLHDNDIVKVLEDETHNDAISYYRWGATAEVFTYIGSQGPFYTKAEVDTALNGKQATLTAGQNITITNNVISANGGGTTYQLIDENISSSSNTLRIKSSPEPSDVFSYVNVSSMADGSDTTVVSDIGARDEANDIYSQWMASPSLVDGWVSSTDPYIGYHYADFEMAEDGVKIKTSPDGFINGEAKFGTPVEDDSCHEIRLAMGNLDSPNAAISYESLMVSDDNSEATKMSIIDVPGGYSLDEYLSVDGERAIMSLSMRNTPEDSAAEVKIRADDGVGSVLQIKADRLQATIGTNTANNMVVETWTFTLDDNTTVTKKVLAG